MPNRIVRDGLIDSDSVCGLTAMARDLYIRILLAVDDFGRLNGRSSWIKSKCYPMAVRLDSGVMGFVAEATVDGCLREIVDAGLVMVYESGGQQFLAVLKFRNRPRAKTGKCPPPPDTPDGEACVDGRGLAILPSDGQHVFTERPAYVAHLRADAGHVRAPTADIDSETHALHVRAHAPETETEGVVVVSSGAPKKTTTTGPTTDFKPASPVEALLHAQGFLPENVYELSRVEGVSLATVQAMVDEADRLEARQSLQNRCGWLRSAIENGWHPSTARPVVCVERRLDGKDTWERKRVAIANQVAATIARWESLSETDQTVILKAAMASMPPFAQNACRGLDPMECAAIRAFVRPVMDERGVPAPDGTAGADGTLPADDDAGTTTAEAIA